MSDKSNICITADIDAYSRLIKARSDHGDNDSLDSIIKEHLRQLEYDISEIYWKSLSPGEWSDVFRSIDGAYRNIMSSKIILSDNLYNLLRVIFGRILKEYIDVIRLEGADEMTHIALTNVVDVAAKDTACLTIILPNNVKSVTRIIESSDDAGLSINSLYSRLIEQLDKNIKRACSLVPLDAGSGQCVSGEDMVKMAIRNKTLLDGIVTNISLIQETASNLLPGIGLIDSTSLYIAGENQGYTLTRRDDS